MFSPDSLHESQIKGESRSKSDPNPYDMDVVTGPSGLRPAQDTDQPEPEAGGWQDGTMS